MDLMASLRELVSDFAYEARVGGCTLELSGPETAIGTWDRLRVGQIVTNLLTNAVKYGAGNPIEVVVTTSRSSVRVAVADHGIGIAPESIERIFERFERGDVPRDRGGLGIGLYVARSLVEAHGGTIEVQSTPGRGSIFSFTLPFESSVTSSKPAGDAP
jgi:signal transduction histidine kinase